MDTFETYIGDSVSDEINDTPDFGDEELEEKNSIQADRDSIINQANQLQSGSKMHQFSNAASRTSIGMNPSIAKKNIGMF